MTSSLPESLITQFPAIVNSPVYRPSGRKAPAPMHLSPFRRRPRPPGAPSGEPQREASLRPCPQDRVVYRTEWSTVSLWGSPWAPQRRKQHRWGGFAQNGAIIERAEGEQGMYPGPLYIIGAAVVMVAVMARAVIGCVLL